MPENVKIKIKEVDRTTAGGRSTDSSDVAFIPGLSVGAIDTKYDVPANIPVLCTSVDDFEKRFGKTPYQYTEEDVEGYTHMGFNAGDYDKSYIFAKELLYQGMPIYYANVGGTVNSDLSEYTFLGYSDGIFLNNTSSDNLISDYQKNKSLEVDKGEDEVTVVTVHPALGCFPSDILKNNRYSCSLTCELEYTYNEKSYKSLHRMVASKNSDSVNNTFGYEVKYSYARADEISATLIPDPDNAQKFGEFLEDTMPVVFEFGDFTYIIDWSKLPESVSQVAIKFYDTYSEASGASATSGKIAEFYTNVGISIDQASDKSLYSIKYLTSGGYPSVYKLGEGTISTTVGSDLLDAARKRGDAVALIDYQMTTEQSIYDPDDFDNTVYGILSGIEDAEGYATAMYPWAPYSCANGYSGVEGAPLSTAMPASYAYLMCVARAIKFSPSWLAMAGVSRGVVPGIKGLYTKDPLTNTIAENLQPKFGSTNHNKSINCITEIRPYGLTIWGNRTLKAVGPNGTVAQNFLNIRNMISDIKKVFYTTGKSLMFEQNTESLWMKFKAGVSPLLDSLVSGGALENYKIIKGTKKYNGDPLTKGELAAVVKIYPTYAVEYFELVVEINDSDVTVV